MKKSVKFTSFLILIIVSAFLLNACAPVTVYTDYVRSQDFRQYKTYAWLQRADSVHNYWYDNPLIEKNTKNYGNVEMQNRGYTVDIYNPDLLLEYHTTVKKQHYTVSNPVYSSPTYNYSPYGYNPARPYAYNNTPYITGYTNQQIEYNEETLVIDIIDRKLNQLIWRGWSVGTVNDERDLEAQLKTDIHKIFNKYPVPVVRK